MKNAWNELSILERIYVIILGICFVFYGGLMLYFCCRTDALVPDELWFLGIAVEMRDYSLLDLIKTPNLLGYGSFYWITLALLRNILAMRIFSWVCLMVVPICIFLVLRKHLKRTWKNIFFVMILFFSCPMSWFTGKIIGPELYGNALGVIGVSIILLKSERENKSNWIYVLGGVFIGLSTGIKLYNLVFGLFIGLYEIWDGFFNESSALMNRFKSLFLKGLLIIIGCIFGFIICNPIIIWDRTTYMGNIVDSSSAFSLSHVKELLFMQRIEWDLVNSGGFCHCIISILGLILVFLFGCFFKDTRKISFAALISFCSLIMIFSVKGRVLGWYYIPFLFIIPLCVGNCNIYWGVILLNLVLIYPNTLYQIDTKFDQIANIENEERIEKFIENVCFEYKDYERVYFVDVCMKNIGMYPEYSYIPHEKQIIVISKRARNNNHIEKIYLSAVKGTDGFRLIDEKDGISIVLTSSRS